MSLSTLGIFIATHGDARLLRTLHSIMTQKLIPGDDIIIVGDGFHQWTADTVNAMGAPFRYVPIQQTRDWGHTQGNYGIENVGGDYIMGQDHDDIYLPRAFEKLRAGILSSPPNQPLMVRVRTPELGILWTAPAQGLFDGHCLVAPNDKTKIGRLTSAYDGDQNLIMDTLRNFGKCGWYDIVTVLTRPKWKLWPYPQEVDRGWKWLFLNEDMSIPLGSLSLEYVADRLFASWSPQITREAWREITEFMLWSAQGETLYFNPQSDGQKQFLLDMGFRFERSGTMYIYWPPDETLWRAT